VKSILKRNTPEVRVFDASLCFFALCDGAEELHTDTAFDEAGEFSLTAPLDAADDFPIDGIAVTEEGDFLIESVTRDSLAGTVTVAGRGILAFFSRRVIPHRTVYTGRAEALVLDLVSQWAPAVLPGTLSTLDYGLEETVTVDLAPGTLYSVLRSVCTEIRIRGVYSIRRVRICGKKIGKLPVAYTLGEIAASAVHLYLHICKAYRVGDLIVGLDPIHKLLLSVKVTSGQKNDEFA